MIDTSAKERKKSFLLYFDAYPRIAELPAEQRGELLSALFEFAMDAAEGQAELGSVIGRHPDMTLATQMALGFMADTIHRDTELWREKQSRYSRAARERLEREGKTPAAGNGAELAKYVQALHREQREP